MKTTDFIIIYLLIVFPLLVFTQWRSEDTNAFAKLNNRYDGAVTVASQDAVDQLRLNVKPNYESGYDSKKFSRINKEVAYDTFIHSLALNFESEDEVTQDLLARYVPVFAVLEYDGLSMNVYRKFENEKLLDRVWLPKMPFAYHDSVGNIINFTLDDHVTVYDVGLDEWISGDRRELLLDVDIAIDLLHDENLFERIRRDTIVNLLQEHFAYQINEHNVYTKNLGITYTFALPLIPQEDWYNTVDDVSIFTFFQGFPYERGGGTYNQFAFSGSRLIKQDAYYATTVNSKKVFFAESCGYDYPIVEVYSSKKEAAKAGYFELSCLNQMDMP